MGKGFFLASMFLAAAFFLFVRPQGAFSDRGMVRYNKIPYNGGKDWHYS